MATAVREVGSGPDRFPVGREELEGCGCLPREPNRRAAPARVYIVRRDGRHAFEGSFADAYTWAVSAGAGSGPVTLTTIAA